MTPWITDDIKCRLKETSKALNKYYEYGKTKSYLDAL